MVPEAPGLRVTLYKPFPVATVNGMVPRKTVIVVPVQQGCAPDPTAVPTTLTATDAGVGNSRWTITD